MSTSTHDLFDFFKKANSNISDEYTRICRRVNEDPGTAGDQGEENWKELLESWIPPYFQIVTKGRILSDSGETSPQVDVIVLSPDYPKSLLNCKEYLSGGVVAAFECKTTLRRKHIGEFIEHSKKIEKLAINENGTPRKDLQSKIYYGLLAHSHEWKKENSNPKENIEKAIWEYDEKYVTHPREIPDIICVADLGVWKSQKMIVPNYDNGKGLKGNYVMSGYIASDNKEEFFTPVGSCVFDLLQNIAWRYPSVRDIVTYMRKLNISGSGSGYSRPWEWSILSEETQENIYRLSYTLHGDYYLPDLVLNEEEPIYGKYGMLRKQFLKEHRLAKYQYLLLTGKLTEHLNQIDQESREQVEMLMEQMAEKQGVTEELKVQNRTKWVRLMNNIKASAEEMVLREILYI